MLNKLIIFTLILSLITPAYAGIVSQESWTSHITLQGSADDPIVISPLSKIDLSDKAGKVIVLPEKIEIKEELQEFRLFRNRYVIFGCYLFAALYYNWLTRYR
jgi:hypothetical protein